VKRRLADAAELPSLSAAESDLHDARRSVRRVFHKLLEHKAA